MSSKRFIRFDLLGLRRAGFLRRACSAAGAGADTVQRIWKIGEQRSNCSIAARCKLSGTTSNTRKPPRVITGCG